MIDVHVEAGAGAGSGDDPIAPLLGALVPGRSVTLLVRHRTARRHDPQIGNALAREAVERLWGVGVDARPVAVVAPVTSDPGALVADALRHDPAAFWLGHDAWRGRIATPSAARDALLAALGRAGRPLLVPLERWGDATAIGAATAELGVPVVLVDAHYDHIVDDLAAAERYPHLLLETSALAHFRAVARVVERLGPDRLVFGSGAPERTPWSPLGVVLGASIADAAKRAILSGTSARVFGIQATAADDVAALPTPGPIVDVHAHLGGGPWDVIAPDDRALAAALAADGVGRVAASSIRAILGDRAAGNTTARGAAGSGVLTYVVGDPDDLPGTDADLRAAAGSSGVVGLKVHCQWSGRSTASRPLADLVALAARHVPLVKIHVDGAGWPEALGALADRHRDLRILVAHGGPGCPSVEAAEVAASRDNVVLEFASSFAHLPTVRAAVALAGPERIAFGSDAPLLDPAWALGTYRAAIGPGRLADVLGRNGDAVLGLAA